MNENEINAPTAPGNMVASEEAVSLVARLRMDFETYQQLDHSFDQTTYDLWRQARDSIRDRDVVDMLRIVFAHIDEQAAVIQAQREQLAAYAGALNAIVLRAPFKAPDLNRFLAYQMGQIALKALSEEAQS